MDPDVLHRGPALSYALSILVLALCWAPTLSGLVFALSGPASLWVEARLLGWPSLSQSLAGPRGLCRTTRCSLIRIRPQPSLRANIAFSLRKFGGLCVGPWRGTFPAARTCRAPVLSMLGPAPVRRLSGPRAPCSGRPYGPTRRHSSLIQPAGPFSTPHIRSCRPQSRSRGPNRWGRGRKKKCPPTNPSFSI